MQLSSKIIKEMNVDTSGEEEISSKFEFKKVYNKNVNKISPKVLDKSSVENVANGIIQESRKKSSKIIREAYDKACCIQEEAIQKGYKKGHEAGYKKGYDEGYKKSVDEAKNEADKIKDNAKNILMSAEDKYEKYFCKKEKDVKNLVINIVSKVLKKEIENVDCFSDMINDYLNECKKSKTIIIKSNGIYIEKLNQQVEMWKKSCGYMGEIFVLDDNLMEKGKVEIQKDNGKMYVDINECIEKIEDLIKNS